MPEANLCWECAEPTEEPCLWFVPHGTGEVWALHFGCAEAEGSIPKATLEQWYADKEIEDARN